MSIKYFKRFRMEIDLERRLPEPRLPEPYRWIAWSDGLVSQHAEVKYRCFCNEIDADLFPCLRDPDGCLSLMKNIAERRGFLPSATWLIGGEGGYVGTIQGVVQWYKTGVIQNLGVIPEARNLGLGSALLLKALKGFAGYGLERGVLEVTADNVGAVRLYERLGFERIRTVFKEAEEH